MPESNTGTPLIDQTRKEISRLVAEIEMLAEKDIRPDEFCAEYLRRVAASLATRASAIWMKSPSGEPVLQYQINLHAVGLDVDEYTTETHKALLRHTLAKAKPLLVPPQSGPGDGEDSPQVRNPTDLMLLLAPIMLDGESVGLIEIVQDAGRRSSAQQGYLNFLARIANEAGKYLKNRKYRQYVGQETLFNELDSFIRSVHGGLHPKQVSYLIANDGKKFIKCERVSVALKRSKSKKTRIEAISGEATVEKRSNLVRKMAMLADSVLQHGENIIYSGEITDHWPADTVDALEKYLEESNSNFVAILPMEDQREFRANLQAKTALVVEMIEDPAEPEDLAGKMEAVCLHGGGALYNALEYHRIPMLWFWRMIGGFTEWFTGDRLAKVIAGLQVFIMLCAFMCFYQWDLKLEGSGELVPEIRRNVFAPMDGLITDIKVKHGDRVQKGQILTEMFNPELRKLEVELRGAIKAGERQKQSLDAQKRADPRDEKIRGEINQLLQQIDGKKRQLQLLQTEMADLMIRSPIEGWVTNWKIEDTLRDRPVRKGEMLMEIADHRGDWVLEVQYPESTVTHIARAFGRLKKDEPKELPVTYVLSADPDRTYEGILKKVYLSTAAVAKPDTQEIVVEAKITLPSLEEDEESFEKFEKEEDYLLPPQVRTGVGGVGVRAKANCGPHAVGYVLFRELIDFVREYIFF